MEVECVIRGGPMLLNVDRGVQYGTTDSAGQGGSDKIASSPLDATVLRLVQVDDGRRASCCDPFVTGPVYL